MIVPLGHAFLLAAIIFSMGLVCIMAHRNLIMTLVGVEVMMNAAAIAFVAAALRWQLRSETCGKCFSSVQDFGLSLDYSSLFGVDRSPRP